MDNETKIKVEFKNSVTNQKKLDNYEKQLQNIYSLLSAIDKGRLAQLGEFNVTLTKISDNTQNIEKGTSKLSKNLINAFGISKLVVFGKMVTKVAKLMSNLTQKSSEYVENLNLLEVAYSNVNRKTGEFNEDIKITSARIENLVDKMSDVYGLDESNLSRSFGIFKQLANAMELPTETAENLSELMVKMTNDIASLYNLPLNRASNALQSALAGQVRPIRSATGADITEKTLQKTVDALELDTTISKLSFVEKRLVMVISLTNQLKNSQGDYGRTIESVANQVRVMHEQWDRLTRAVGNVFYPLMKSIMPVLNGVLMALTEIFNIIATLVGFKMEEFDYSGLAGVSEYALDIEEEFNGAGASVDNLKKKLNGLRSFDKLNVISSQKNTSSGTGVGSGTIDPKILKAFADAFSDYDDQLDKVRMKANDIRDSIMEWLGFTKQVNPLTGEIEWKYQGIGKTFSNLYKTIKNMSPLMKVMLTGITGLAGIKIVNGIKNLATAFGNKSGLAQAIKQVNEEDTFGLLSAGTKFKNSIDLWSKNLTGVEKFKMGLIGAGGLVISLGAVEDSMKNIATTGKITEGDVAKSFAGILGSAGSLALGLGAQFGASGAIVGLIGGTFLGIADAWSKFTQYANTNLKDIEEQGKIINEKYEELKKLQDETNLQFQVSDAHTTYYQTLYEELQSIVDENDKIKEGYEDRAKVITNELAKALGIEIKIVDGVIENYDNLKASIDDLIKKKEALAKLNVLEAEHEKALENIGDARKKESEAYASLEQAKSNYLPKLEKEAEVLGISTDELHKYLLNQKDVRNLTIEQRKLLEKIRPSLINYAVAYQEASDNQELASKTLDGYNKIILDWNRITTYAEQENYDAMNLYFDHLRYLYDKDIEEQNKYWDTIKNDNQRYLNDLERNRNKYDEATYKQLKENYEGQIALADYETTKLKYSLIKNTSEISDEVVDFYYNMGKKSTEEFVTEMQKLPDAVQSEIVDKIGAKGKELSEEFQKGINQVKTELKIKVDADTSSATSKINDLINNNKTLKDLFGILGAKLKTSSSSSKISQNANGGMPPVGQLFIANEKGPELIGQIGGKSFVANQNQMIDLLDKKIGNAQKSTGTQVINLYLDADHKIGSYTLDQLQNMAKTDGKPITIGG